MRPDADQMRFLTASSVQEVLDDLLSVAARSRKPFAIADVITDNDKGPRDGQLLVAVNSDLEAEKRKELIEARTSLTRVDKRRLGTTPFGSGPTLGADAAHNGDGSDEI